MFWCVLEMSGRNISLTVLGVLVINNYGPSLYQQLGFSQVKQLLYPAAWLTFATGMNAVAMFFV
jgi:hypothetical protein